MCGKSDARLANIPSAPHTVYKHEGWQGYGHWLGTGNIKPGKRGYLPFAEALLYARSLKLKGAKEWNAWCKTEARLAKMPSCPNKVYRHEGWQGYGHWLGTGNIKCGKLVYMPFAEALRYARSLKLKSVQEWEAWRKSAVRPANIPSHPDRVYTHEGWQGYGHWLGTGHLAGRHGQTFLPFKHALLYARSLMRKTKKGWEAWCKSGVRPANIPSHPETVYKHDGWQGYGHWLGTGNDGVKKDKQFLPFK